MGREVHAVLWRDGEIIDLGTLGGTISQAHAINDRGQVVGSSATGFQDRPFLWEDGRMTDLTAFVDPALGATGGGAFRINERGQVLGMVSTLSGSETPLTRTILWRAP
jgi:probable HAF family extracellular repeat protein